MTRAAWVAQARARAAATGADQDFTFALGGPERASLLVLGDPGEGDDSQYAVVPSLLSQADGVAAAVICSDVIYPTGDTGDYRNKFYKPYRDLHAPILALPGNHDWYDGLHGFMHHICGLDEPTKPPPGPALGGWLRRRLWRTSPGATALDLEHMVRARAAADQVLTHRSPGPTGRSTPGRCASSRSTPGSSARSTPSRRRGWGGSRAPTRAPRCC